MAKLASQNDAVVIQGTKNSVHFHDEVFSWHNLNGADAEELLPSILITNRHPREFKESFGDNHRGNPSDLGFKIILFPLRKYCKTTTDVAIYIDKIFKDIISREDLSDFKVFKEMNKGIGNALVDGLVLEPNIAGLGFNFKSFIKYLSEK